MKKKIAIIGSGVAGLVLGNFIQANTKFEPIIYEKKKSLDVNEGFGIQLAVNSISILNKIGFNKLSEKDKFFPSKLNFYSSNNKICDLDLIQFNYNNNKYTTLKRSVLIKFLQEKLSPNSIIFNKKINTIKQIKEKLKINFEDGTIDEVDYLVISDGFFSETKLAIEKKSFKYNFYNSVAIRATINHNKINDFDKENISIIMNSNGHIVFYPVNKQKDINLVSIIRQKLNYEDLTKLSDTNFINSILKNSALKKNQKLSYLFQEDLKAWPIYSSKNSTRSNYKNVFYIGDAFYTFLPTMAQGASQSIEGAYELFKLISNYNKDMQNKYFKIRLHRTNLITKRSKFNFFIFHLSNPILIILRNNLLKILLKSKIFINIYLGKIYQ